jgi:N-acetylglucosaminyldiphosphoundecaprenol N-acetyl-beta-D-mannosaminyltransferase
MNNIGSKEILGVRVDMGLDVVGVVSSIEAMLTGDKTCRLICTTNPEFVMEAQKDTEFRNIVNSSALSVPDGIGIVAADYYLDRMSTINKDRCYSFKSFILGLGVKILLGKFTGKRITGVILAEELFKLSAKKGYSIFLLGGRPRNWLGSRIDIKDDFATRTAEVIRKKYPGVNIIGSTSEFDREEIDDEKTVRYIHDKMKERNVETLDMLLVAYNQNKQEKWISRNANKIPVRISVGVGGTFDYLVGHYKQVPDIVTKSGLDWVFRLATQPFRIRRIINAFPIFPIKIFLSALKNKNR